MMFERFTGDARTVVVHAQAHARRLGHRYIGCEHLLLAVVSTGQPASAVLRENGLTPEHVEVEIVRLAGLGAGASLFADLDRDALASIGIDLDAVRARIEAAFGPEALTRAGRAIQCGPRPSRLNPRRAVPPSLVRRWRRWRRGRRPVIAPPAPAATGIYQATGPGPSGHIPFTPGAKRTLQNALLEAQARHDNYIGVEHITLGLIAIDSGLVPPILSAVGVSAATLRTAVLNRYRQAG
jgi:ATP-dependent Clp protease ATP-binding subunit ClpA